MTSVQPLTSPGICPDQDLSGHRKPGRPGCAGRWLVSSQPQHYALFPRLNKL